MLAILLWPPTATAHVATQPATVGAICITTFADANGNGLREVEEAPLAGVMINLTTGGAIVAIHIMGDNQAQYCFEQLVPGIYTVTFTDSPLYRTTTANEGTFQLEAGQRLTINDFGAVPTGVSGLRAQVAAASATDDEPMERSTRLLLATGGSTSVMLLMVGVGAVILGVMSGRTRKQRSAASQPPRPDEIAPPTTRALIASHQPPSAACRERHQQVPAQSQRIDPVSTQHLCAIAVQSQRQQHVIRAGIVRIPNIRNDLTALSITSSSRAPGPPHPPITAGSPPPPKRLNPAPPRTTNDSPYCAARVPTPPPGAVARRPVYPSGRPLSGGIQHPA